MTTEKFCDPCDSEKTSTKAVKLCAECEEKLCKECCDWHSKFKAFKSHHLIEVSLISVEFLASQKYCDKHTEVYLDFYCPQHDTICCRVCIPEVHQTCKNVQPLDFASEGIKNSSLLKETFDQMDNLTRHLKHLLEANSENVIRNEKTKPKLLQQIAMFKEVLINRIAELESKLSNDLNMTELQVKAGLEKQKISIAKILSEIEKTRSEIDWINTHGTNAQLFFSLKNFETTIKATEMRMLDIVSTLRSFEIKFESNAVDFESLGSISMIATPCEIESPQIKAKQAQAHSNMSPITKFEYVGDIEIKAGDEYDLTDFAITADNQLLLCNYDYKYRKVYVYKDCKEYRTEVKLSIPPFRITLIPDTVDAVILQHKSTYKSYSIHSLQFLNVTTMEKTKSVKLRSNVHSIAATYDKIILGGENKILLLDTRGLFIKWVVTPGIGNICFTKINHNSDILLCGFNKVRCVDFSGNNLYQYELKDLGGMTVDRQGLVYVGAYESHEIHRLSANGQFKDIVLTKKDGIGLPVAMAFNSQFNKFFVKNTVTSQIMIYNCS